MAEPSKTEYLYQIVGFHFRVTFNDSARSKKRRCPLSISIRTGCPNGYGTLERRGAKIALSMCFRDGGSFPGTLTLKRGILKPGKSGLTDWCIDTFNNLKIVPLGVVIVELLDENHNVLLKWDVNHVWPKSWKVAELNAERGEVLIETLELNFNRFILKNP